MNKLLHYAMLAALSVASVACSSSGDGDGSGDGGASGGDVSGSDTVVGTFPKSEVVSTVPQPTLGYRWVLNETFSDEFNGTTLDSSKWYDYHPTWYGRWPGYFLPSNVSVSDGTMKINGSYLGENSGYWAYGSEYTVGCGAVVSKNETAHYGYYECCFKANKTTLSTTFWLSSKSKFDTDGTQPSSLGEGQYAEEIDICETIGRNPSGTSFANGMHSNVHYKYYPTVGTDTTYSKTDVNTDQYREDGQIPSDCYNIYGCWWRDESNATFYLNANDGIDVLFYNSTVGVFKFPQPMGMNFVVETYDWVETPTEDELEDPDKNVSYYDWVRSYTLESMTSAPTSIPEMSQIFTNQIALDESTIVVSGFGAFTFKVSYTAPENSVIKILLCDPSTGEVLMSSVANAYAGYGYLSVAITEPTEDLSKYTVVAYLLENSSTSITDAYVGDSFEFTAI